MSLCLCVRARLAMVLAARAFMLSYDIPPPATAAPPLMPHTHTLDQTRNSPQPGHNTPHLGQACWQGAQQLVTQRQKLGAAGDSLGASLGAE